MRRVVTESGMPEVGRGKDAAVVAAVLDDVEAIVATWRNIVSSQRCQSQGPMTHCFMEVFKETFN